jgi:hypothetical protein
MKSLGRISDARLPDAFLRYALETCENTFVRPTWWRGLTEVDRRRAMKRMAIHVSPFTPSIDDLKDDGVQLMPHRVGRRIGLLAP